MRSSRIIHLSLVLTVAFHTATLAQAIKYSVQEIPILPVAYDYFEGAVNDNSVVVGTGGVGADMLCFRWQDGVLTALPKQAPPNCCANAYDINNSNIIVGQDWSAAVSWINDNEIFLGGTSPRGLALRGSAMCINSDGDAAGWWRDSILEPQSPELPAVYSATTGSFRLLNFGSVTLHYFYGINDYDDIVGTAWTGDQNRTFVYHNDTLTLLNTSGPEYINSVALGINNFGKIVGYENTASSPSYSLRAVLWEIGNPNPHVLAENAFAHAINDSGTVVGWFISSPVYKAAIIADGQAIDLNTLIPPNTYPYLTRAVDINNKGQILCHGGNKYFLLTPEGAITVRDAKNDVIPNVEFNLIKVTNDPPAFTEDTLGSFTTDSRGRLGLTVLAKDTFTVDLSTGTKQLVVGDSLKIAKHVESVPAEKHPIVLGTMYSVHLDNAHFAEDGHMYFDTLKSSGLEVVLNHTELRYNLLASVQWEATDSYLKSLENNFRLMSEYLYDVTDGQLRLDTVYIFDDNAFPDQADMLIRASNLEWPRAHVGGILNYGAGHINMPRMFLGDSTSIRNHTDRVYPLDLNANSSDYRTKTHEFGHYALGFWDEYMFRGLIPFLYSADDALRCLPLTIFNYGFMDHQYERNGKMSSEMSGAFRYDMASCRNTNQWGVHGMSCWDHLERWVEAVPWGADNLYVPILKPDAADTTERVVTEPAVFFEGPNNDMAQLDYHVGYLMSFPNSPSPQAPGYSDKHVKVTHADGGENADVQLINDPETSTETIINQGRTSDAAGAWVVGVKNASYKILAGKGGSGATVTPSPIRALAEEETTDWLYGVAESGGSGVSKVGNWYSANSAEDSITIEMKKVQGYYPLICAAELLATSVRYDLTSVQPFSADPTLELWPSYGGSYDETFTPSTAGYEAVVADSLGNGGSFTLWAVDDSAATFFVPTRYVVQDVDHSQPLIWLLGPEGHCEFKLDSTNGTLERALILSSPYPVVRTGLDPNAVQAGRAHSLSMYPDNPLAGTNQVIIRYDDADLKLGDSLLGDESALTVYHWVDASTGWELIGGSVDTADNALYAPISETGVYAAFTTNIITDVEDDERGDILPYHFELSQNYPNPFNPMTTIEYSVPSRTDVTIEIFNVLGQKVRTLVNEAKSAGSYRTEWNGVDDAGRPVSTGVYLYRFEAGEVVQTKKMLLIK